MRKTVLLLACLCAALPLLAQHPTLDYFLPDTCNYNKAIPVPASVLGFEVAQLQATPEKTAEYYRAVAAASDRVELIQYGWTHERRPLLLAIVSTPENIRNLDKIKASHAALTDPSANAPADGPVFTWLGHSIHGNETSGMNASLLLLYHLAAAQTPFTQHLLENSIILIDPMINPDGIARFTEWANSHKSYVANPDYQELEHNEAWPGGRSNHYWFDLNRDWINQTQPESESRAVVMLDWKPNVYTCAHEQGSDANYHFSPGAPTRVHPLIPDECQELIGRLARDYYAPAFDKQQMMYFSGEVFDDYFPGRGREYMDFFGGIALLWEQPSSRGFLRNTANGLLSFEMTVHNQLTMELATIRGAVDMRKDLLDYQKRYFRQTGAEGSGYYVFGSSTDLASTRRFAELIAGNGVEIYHLDRKLSAGGTTFVPDSAFVVPVRQATHRMVEILFEIRESYKDSIAYDITGWTMPMSYNLPYAKVASASMGRRFEKSEPVPVGKLSRASYAYVFEWTGFYAPKALYKLLSAGVYAKVAQSPFEAQGRTFGRGTIVVPVGRAYQQVSEDAIYALMEQFAREDFLDIYALESGYTAGHNIGSGVFAPVRLPRVAVVGSNGASAVPTGDLWHLLDCQYAMPLSIIPSESLGSADLSRYNVLFLTAAHGDLSGSVAEKVKAWVAAGGTLVTIEQGIRFLNRLGISGISMKASQRETNIPYEDIAVSVRARSIPGVILDASIDITHPLCYGYERANLPVFKNNALIIEPLENALRTPVVHPDGKVLLSGNLLPSLQESLRKTPAAVVSRLGQGRIVSFTFDPNFRGIWYGTAKLTANAIFWPELISGMSM